MFLYHRNCPGLYRRFPRMRGDVPEIYTTITPPKLFSPHARGCSAWTHRIDKPNVVFPACAGMFRPLAGYIEAWPSFPRMRGDVPRWSRTKSSAVSFSPHARGCSVYIKPNIIIRNRFPRMRGDVPYPHYTPPGGTPFSPHARGCSGKFYAHRHLRPVFPACAGMFLSASQMIVFIGGFPRMRGDVPLKLRIS